MPIPLTNLTRTLVPRVVTPAVTVAEVLHLFAEQPEPYRWYTVVRAGADAYAVVALNDIREVTDVQEDSLLLLPLGAVDGLLRFAPPTHFAAGGAHQGQGLEAAAQRRSQCRQRLLPPHGSRLHRHA